MALRFRNIKFLFADFHPLTKLFLLLFGMLSVFFIITFIGMLFALPIFNLSLNDINILVKNNFEGAENNFIKYFQGIQTLGFFIVPGLLFWFLFFNKSNQITEPRNKIYGLTSIIVLLTIISLVPLISVLVIWNSEIQFPSSLRGLETTLQKLESDATVLTEKILVGDSISQYLFNLLIIGILPAIGEEFIFRGVLQQILASWIKNSHYAILIASIIFSAFHLQFYGFIPRLLLGFYFGYIFFWSKNIWLAVLAHFFNNALAVSIHFLSLRNINIPAYFSDESISWLNISVGTIFSVFLIWITWALTRQHTRDINVSD